MHGEDVASCIIWRRQKILEKSRKGGGKKGTTTNCSRSGWFDVL